MKDKLQEYALLAEIIGGIAIVASLLFVGVQINQNHQMMRAQIRNDIATNLSERLWNMSQMEDLNVIGFYDSASDITTISPEVGVRTSLFYGSFFRLYENIHYQYEIGLFDESEFEVEASGWRGFVNDPVRQQYFCSNSTAYSEGFRNYIFSLMEKPCSEIDEFPF